MPQANITEHVLFYEDTENPSNPLRKVVDWKRTATTLPFDQVFSERVVLGPQESRVIEPTVGAVDYSSTPVNAVAGVAKPNWCHFVGFGTMPVTGIAVVGTVTLAAVPDEPSLALLTGVALDVGTAMPGDWIYLPGSGYAGDSGPWSPVNQGFWKIVVVNSDSTQVLLKRVYPGDSFTPESVTTTGSGDVQWMMDSQRYRWLLVQGRAPYDGVYRVVGMGQGWIAVEAKQPFLPADTLYFRVLEATTHYLAYIRVESNKPIVVKVGATHGNVNDVNLIPQVVHRHESCCRDEPSVWYEAFAWSTSLEVFNDGGSGAAVVNVIYTIKGQSINSFVVSPTRGY